MLDSLIICIIEHPKFGWIISPYIKAETGNEAFFAIKEKITSVSQLDENSFLFENERKIFQLFEEITDKAIHKVFSKKKDTTKDFLISLKNEYILNHIRPYIESRIVKIFRLFPDSRFKLFLKKEKYGNIYHSDEIRLDTEKTNAIFNFIRTNDGIRYYLSIDNFKLTHQNPIILSQEPCILLLRNTIFFFQSIDAKKIMPFLTKEFIFVPKAAEKKYFETFVANAIRNYEVNNEGFDITTINPRKQVLLSFEKDLKNNPVIVLVFKYNKHNFYHTNDSEKLVIPRIDNEVKFEIINRDLLWEKKHINLLEELGLAHNNFTNFYLKKSSNSSELQYGLIHWINEHNQQLVDFGFSIKQNFHKDSFYLGTYNHEIKIYDNTDWFDIYGKIIIGKFEIPFIHFKKNIISGIREYFLPDNSIFIIPKEWFAKYEDIFKFGETDEEKVKLKKHHFQIIEKNINGLDNNLLSKLKNLKNDKLKTDYPLPDNLNAKLRNYQEEGYAWMRFLNTNDFGGCLADDMGLGKTIQTLTLLLNFKKNNTSAKKNTEGQLDLFQTEPTTIKKDNSKHASSLIVMPASLIHNWQNEIKKFTPDLKVNAFIGAQRTKNVNSFNNYDIILTTYGTLRKESFNLSKYMFNYIILDESQVIKNPNSKTYKSAKELQSKHKLVLTGTPIENSLSDLWAQFNFFNEGLLGNFGFFKKEFLMPIEKNNDEEKIDKLQTIINPFILRRTKEQVEKDLPELTEQVRYCTMTQEQILIYEMEKSKIRNIIFDNISHRGIAKSSIHILQGLTKLRQLANHPVLTENDYTGDSGKFEEIKRVLQNILAENHKVLIFSSFVKHLNLFEDYFKENSVQYSLLTGKSKNREQIINGFQENQENKVFLISLKAGGTGLNLTQADYVFILDPWWNPASELQAAGRAHRIGQKRKVFLYRFITENSIEEKIVKLQEKKSMLSESLIKVNNPLKNLREEDIEHLFK